MCNTIKRNLRPGAVKTGLVTKASNYRAVKHLPASLWAEKPSPGWGRQNGNAVSHSNNITSPWPQAEQRCPEQEPEQGQAGIGRDGRNRKG